MCLVNRDVHGAYNDVEDLHSEQTIDQLFWIIIAKFVLIQKLINYDTHHRTPPRVFIGFLGPLGQHDNAGRHEISLREHFLKHVALITDGCSFDHLRRYGDAYLKNSVVRGTCKIRRNKTNFQDNLLSNTHGEKDKTAETITIPNDIIPLNDYIRFLISCPLGYCTTTPSGGRTSCILPVFVLLRFFV